MATAPRKLTKTVVDAIKADGRDVTHWDAELPRFGLRVRPSGAKSYVVQYRNEHGATKRVTIGSPGEVWTPDAARKRARDLLAEVGTGADPATEKREKRGAMTVAELSGHYLADHAEPHLRPATVRDLRGYLRRHILPALGARKVAEVSGEQVSKLHLSLRDTPAQANRVLANLSSMFAFAIKRKLRADNPCKGVPKFPEEKRARFASADELERLYAALANYPDQGVANAVRLLILTGARLSEVVKASWDMFDFERGVWTKPSAHTKQKKIHVVPLGSETLALLAAMHETRDEDSPYLFPGKKPKKKPTEGDEGRSTDEAKKPEEASKPKPRADLKRLWDALMKEAKLENFRKHDLRHTYASLLVREGVPLFDVGKLLGHTQIATTMRYAHLADDPLRKATNRVGAVFASLGKGQTTGEVVPLPVRARKA